jgi:hydantoinase/carbamoylase family amidase
MAEATAMVREWAEQAGATVHLDGASNLIAEAPGTEPGLAPMVTGSHLDSVIDAGPLDGAYGVVAGIEVLAALAESGVRLRHPLRVVAYANEEGLLAVPFTGSRAIAGTIDPAELDRPGPDGVTLADRLLGFGADDRGALSARWDHPVAAVVELHVEQGPVLDRLGVTIGVVTAITGQQRGWITVAGSANHAGTTPMDMRRDALVAAAEAVLTVRDLALERITEVATVGRLEVAPNVGNVVPGSARLTFDIRSAERSRLDAAVKALETALAAIAEQTGTTITVELQPTTDPAPTDPALRGLITRIAGQRGLTSTEMLSGAGHDSAHLAALGPMAMIFVPSVGGVSHHPAETTTPDDLVAGASVLLDTILALDALDDRTPPDTTGGTTAP